MKRRWIHAITLLIIAGLISAPAVPASAGTSVTEAKASYQKALKAESAAKKKYDAANKKYQTGAYGFYQWIANNYTGWKRTDAQRALYVLNNCSYKKYTKKGNARDATSLANMRRAVKLYPTLKKKRDNDKFHPNLQPPQHLHGELGHPPGQPDRHRGPEPVRRPHPRSPDHPQITGGDPGPDKKVPVLHPCKV